MKTRSYKWAKEDFLNAVKSSVSISEILRKLGLKPRGANYFTVKKFIREWNVDTSHMLGKAHLKGKKRENLPFLPLEKVMIENSNYNRSNLKRRLIKENILPNKCSICNQSTEWNNKNLVMILDHINGINNDNRIENLRLICPNCNSQQDTFCGRKNKKIYKCKDCGNNMFRASERCEKCSQIFRRKVVWPSYEQLKEDIKELSYTKIGKKYGVSDNAVRKWIKFYERQLN